MIDDAVLAILKANWIEFHDIKDDFIQKEDLVYLRDLARDIRQYILDVIGGDEKVPDDIWAEPKPEKVRAQNELRAEQRNKLREL